MKKNISKAPRIFDAELAQWKAEHRGVISQIAASFIPPVSKSYVSMVLAGSRRGVRGGVAAQVAEALREAGAPLKMLAAVLWLVAGLWAGSGVGRAASIYGYEVDVFTPNVLVDRVTLADTTGVGRTLDLLSDWVVCVEDQVAGDWDYNDACALAPVDGDLVVLGGLAAYPSVIGWAGGHQVEFVTYSGVYATGGGHVWAGRVLPSGVGESGSEVPEPGGWGLVGLGLVGVGLMRRWGVARERI